MIVTSAGNAMTLLGSAGSVLTATEKEKEMQILGQLELCIAKRA